MKRSRTYHRLDQEDGVKQLGSEMSGSDPMVSVSLDI
jgi:hypothetical protein